MLDRDDGYRDDSGYKQAKFFGKSNHDLNSGQLSFALTGSWLDQETAGFITGEDSYKDRETRYRNENPEAYRKANSLRLSSTWAPESNGAWQSEYRFYLRNSDMEFLQHFVPTQPTEKNGQTSGGIMFISRRELSGGSMLTLGVDADLASGFLKEDQAAGNAKGFLPERPDGLHYDYDATSIQTAAFASINVPIGTRWTLQAGLRGEYMRYDYDNNMIDGNTTDIGNPCTDPDNEFPPDGCLYSRQADRTDDFFNLSPNLGALYHFSDTTVGFMNFASGFRAPQATELYRLQAQQDVSEIDSERLDSIEIGTRHQAGKLSLETVAFYMYKRNFIFRDSAGLNVSDGKTKHYGVEANINWRIIEPVYLSFVGSYAEQKYDFNRDAGLGEIISKGNEIDTAPQVLASARLGYEHKFGLAELEWVHQDPYFMDAANTARYDGHDLLNLRLIFDPTENLQLAVRVNNITDEAYADRADLLSVVNPPIYRYFPGRPREVYLEAVWRTGSR
jgi:iron complex outermembrane receptor protein